MSGGHRSSLLLASSSLVALLVGSGAPAAFAACVNNIGASFDNPIANTTPCVAVTNTSFTGNITNEGTISPGGITFSNGTITGFIKSTGTIAGGIGLDANSKVVSAGTAISSSGPTFLGGINNAGTIAAAKDGIGLLFADTFQGGITNSGTISFASGGFGLGISVVDVEAFVGGITNNGMISAGSGLVGTGIKLGGVSTFTGGISNTGIVAVAQQNFAAGVSILGVATFSGGIGNSGVIAASVGGTLATGILILGSTAFAGGISNSGTISAISAHTAQGVGILATSTFNGGIANSGAISVSGTAGLDLLVGGVSNFVGGISNSGTLSVSAMTAAVGVGVSQVQTFGGDITNSGAITLNASSGPAAGIAVAAVAGFVGDISNSGAITTFSATTDSGIRVSSISSFSGSVNNSGTISVQGVGIFLGSVSTFAGHISNSGMINAPFRAAGGVGIFLAGPLTFLGGITNSGTIKSNAVGIEDFFVSSFAGGISNAGTIVLQQVAAFHDSDGISVAFISHFTGGITNSGTITGANFGIGVGDSAFLLCANFHPCTTSTFSGDIVNSGTIIASGAIALFDVVTFQGGITNSGTISGAFGIVTSDVTSFLGTISNSGTISTSNIGIGMGGGVTFVGGPAIVNSGTISALNVGIGIDSGVVFTGTAIVNSGTISGGSAIDVSAASGAVTIDQNAGLIAGAIKLSSNADKLNVHGGTIAGNIIGSGASDTVNFSVGAGTFTYGSAFGFSGIHQAIVSSGTVVLDGANSATDIAVTGGHLQVGDVANAGATLTGAVDVTGAGTLSGHGTVVGAVTIDAGGVLAPGGSIGTLTVTGPLAFHAGSTYAVQIAPTPASSLTVVNGTAALSGGTVVVTLQLGTYGAHVYTILGTTGGLGGTTFAGLTVNGGYSGTITLDYTTTPGSVDLDAGAGSTLLLVPPNANPNQANVINAINAAIETGNALPPGFQALAGLTGNSLLAAAGQLSGENNAGFFRSAFQAGSSFLGLMVDPFVDGRSDDGGAGPASSFAAEPPPALPAAASAFAKVVKATPRDATLGSTRQFRAWGAAYGGSGSVDGDAGAGTHTTTASTAGFAAGADFIVSPRTTLGFALAGAGTNWGLQGGFGGGRSDLFQAGVYGSHHWGSAYVSGALAYNFHDVTTNRTVTVAGTDVLSARFQANGLGARLEGGYRIITSFARVSPYAAAQVQSFFLPARFEAATSGSPQFALAFPAQSATTTRSELGAWLDKSLMLDRARMTLYGRVAWTHDFGDRAGVNAFFQALPGASFIVNGAAPARDGALVTAGAQYGLMNGWSFLAKFDGEFSSTTSIYSGTGMVRKTW